MNEPHDSTPQSSFSSRLSTALVLGSASGVLVSAWDLHGSVQDASGYDLVLATAIGAVPGLLGGLGVGLLLSLVLLAARCTVSRSTGCGLLAGMGLAATVVALTVFTERDVTPLESVARIIGALPLGILMFVVVSRSPRLTRPGRLEALALAIALGCLLVVGGADFLHRTGRGTWSPALPLALGAASLTLGLFGFPERVGRASLGLLLILAAYLGGLVGVDRSPVPDPDHSATRGSEVPPNIMLVVLDTTRRDHLGSYGSTGGYTPALDKLAAEGAVFEDAYTPCHWTAPSHASLFTGKPPISHGCSREYRLWLTDETETLAEMLDERGYDTLALFSNPWLYQANLLQGFDTHVNLLGKYAGLAAGKACTELGAPERWMDKGAAVAGRALSEWFAARGDSSKPFFLFVNLLEAHGKYLPPRAERGAYLPDDVSFSEATALAQSFQTRSRHLERDRNEYAEKVVRALYAGGLRYQDRRLEELVEIVDRWSELDETLLIVTADHGENINDDGRWDHEFDVNDSLIRIPMIIRYPPLFPAGTRVAGMCSLEDVLPTALAVLEDPLPAGQGLGTSLIPAGFEPRSEVYCQMFPHYPDFVNVMRSRGRLDIFAAHWRVVRTADWKFIWSSDGEHQLYDLSADPGETENVRADHPDVVEDLSQRLTTWLEEHPPFVMQDEVPPAGSAEDDANADRLGGLGYTGE